MAASRQDGADLEPHAAAPEKPCRACTDFRSWMKSQRASIGGGEAPARPGKTTTGMDKAMAAATSTATQSTTAAMAAASNAAGSSEQKQREGNSTTVPSSTGVGENEEDPPLWGDAAKQGCPADSVALGCGSWRLLHTMAAYYPAEPSAQQRQDMHSFITLFSKFYPCAPCAEDFREWLRTNTPAVDSQNSLSRWFCNAHNEVNKKLGKPIFDCDRVNERWRDGWLDGSCD